MPLFPLEFPVVFSPGTATTLGALRTRVRERADMPNAGFVSVDALDAWINEGVQILHEKFIEAYGQDYAESTDTFTTVAGTTDYDLPDDFFKLIGVDYYVNADRPATLKPYNTAHRNTHRNVLPTWNQFPRYKLAGVKLRLLPAPSGTYDVTVYYIPTAVILTNADDQVNFPNGWDRYVVLYAAIQALIKEETDVRELKAQLDQWDQQLIAMKQSRDAAFPLSAVDIEQTDYNSDF